MAVSKRRQTALAMLAPPELLLLLLMRLLLAGACWLFGGLAQRVCRHNSRHFHHDAPQPDVGEWC